MLAFEDENIPGIIALYIAAALRYPVSIGDGLLPWSSTIDVLQHKSKFGQVCVYCTLAETNLVNESWAAHGNDGEPSQEFRLACLLADAQTYRSVYFNFVALAPQHREAIIARADFGYLLYESVEAFDAWLNPAVTAASMHPGNKVWLDRLLLMWHASDVEQLRKRLMSVCGFDVVKKR